MASKDSSSQRTAVLLLLSAVLVAFAGWRIFRVTKPSDPRDVIENIQARIGRTVAELAGEAFGGQGRLLVILSDPVATTAEWARMQDEAFRKALAKAGRFEIAAEVGPRAKELVFQDPDSPEAERARAAAARVPGIPKEYLLDLAARHPKLDGIVSLAGEPLALPEQAPELKGKIPPVVCYAVDGSCLPALFKAGIVKAAVAPKRKSTDPDAKVDPFDIQFEVVKPDGVERWWNP